MHADIHRRAGGRAVALLLSLMLGGVAAAQQYIGGDGRLLDANPSVYGGRFNSVVRQPASSLVGGNAFATGLAGRGLSLRSYSPIPSATAFRAPLGSGALSTFRRNSISVSAVDQPLGGLVPSIFIDPETSAYTAGALRSGYAPAQALGDTRIRQQTAGGAFPLTYGNVPRPYSPADPRLGAREVGGIGETFFVDEARRDYDRVPGLQRGEIFGPERLTRPFGRLDLRVGPDARVNPTFIERIESQYGLERDAAEAQAEEIPRALGGPIDMRVWDEPRDLSINAALDTARAPAARQSTLERVFGAQPLDDERFATAPDARRPADRDPEQMAERAAASRQARDVSMLPGHDLYTDMQLALTLRDHPDKAWFAEMQRTAAESLAASEAMRERAQASADEFLEGIMEGELSSFATDHESDLNRALRAAEAAMDLGNYYEAESQYQIAQRLAPNNPLPILGEAHALLAAGEYRTAAVQLVTALTRFPQLAQFDFNLEALLGGGEIVDIRRSELATLLERSEDYELRFLLGWLELHTGNAAFARENLEQAALSAPAGSLIRRFPAVLRSLEEPDTQRIERAPRERSEREEPSGGA